MKKFIILIVILLVGLIILLFQTKLFFFKENFVLEQNKNNSLKKKVLFSLRFNQDIEQNQNYNNNNYLYNFVYYNNNFYLTNQPPYIFTGILSSNGFYKLQNTFGTKDLVLNFNTTDTSFSKIIEMTPTSPILLSNNTKDTLENIFNQTNNHIYLDPINKVILSQDNSGNIVYLTFDLANSPVSWNYNMENGVNFIINYIGRFQ
jgi:hypothetical protein